MRVETLFFFLLFDLENTPHQYLKRKLYRCGTLMYTRRLVVGLTYFEAQQLSDIVLEQALT